MKFFFFFFLLFFNFSYAGDFAATEIIDSSFLEVKQRIELDFNVTLKRDDLYFESKTSYLEKTLYNYGIKSLPKLKLYILVEDSSNKIIDFYLRSR